MKQINFLSILCSVLLSFGSVSGSAETCIQNRQNFIPNGTYDLNRRHILSSLPNYTASQDGYYYGFTGQQPNRVYALGMCIPGSASDDCSDCIKDASNVLIQDCVNQTDAYYWTLDPTLCLVRYSNVSFSGRAAFWETETQYLVLNTATVASNLTEFKNIWDDLTLRVIAAASTARSTSSSNNNYYKADVANLTKFQNMYALMQCTPDISPGDCNNCLRQSVMNYQSCCGNNTGGYVMRPICFFRWQFFTFSKAFGNITLGPPPPPLKHPDTVSQPPTAGDRGKLKDNSRKRTIVVSVVVVLIIVTILIIIILGLRSGLFARKRKPYQVVELNKTGITSVSTLQFKFKTIKSATNNFSDSLGTGGYGDVFKGKLPKGQDIAVKRLRRSKSNLNEGEFTKGFENEVVLVAKLQHRNLVKLLGFSEKGEEKILVYEYLPNGSLDYILFDPTRQRELDWEKRYKIIAGIARGILYLHQDSRLTIIHRDLKAPNILLDADMNPKVADFGTARIFGMDQSVANTDNPAGTPGYMPPEYINLGEYSMKSDVYSYGILVLEIICGKKNTSFSSTHQNIVTYAWKSWGSGSPLDFVDSAITENLTKSEEVTRCIHVALLCVQEDPTDRPDFSTIMSMLTNHSLRLPVPKPPPSFIPDRSNQSTPGSIYHTMNNET